MGCSHNCDSCSAGCGGEKSLKVAANPAATVRKVIGVVSGKGGVGKSMANKSDTRGEEPSDPFLQHTVKSIKGYEILHHRKIES